MEEEAEKCIPLLECTLYYNKEFQGKRKSFPLAVEKPNSLPLTYLLSSNCWPSLRLGPPAVQGKEFSSDSMGLSQGETPASGNCGLLMGSVGGSLGIYFWAELISV